MLKFSYKGGNPFAIIDKGNSKKIIYIKEGKDKLSQELISTYITKESLDPHNELTRSAFLEVIRCLKNKTSPSTAKTRAFHKMAMAKLKLINKSNIDIGLKGKIFPTPNIDGRDIVWIVGKSGCGKSFWCKQFARKYRDIYPSNEIYLISFLDDDETLDEMENIKRIKLQPESITNYEIKPNELANCLLICDDVDSIQNKLVKEFVNNLIDVIGKVGRHTNVSMLCTSHLLYNGSATRVILNECHACVVFPKDSTFRSINHLLTSYFGLSREQVEDIKKINSRWIYVKKSPNVFVYETGCHFYD